MDESSYDSDGIILDLAEEFHKTGEDVQRGS